MFLPLLFCVSAFALPAPQATLDRLQADPVAFRRALPEKSPLASLPALLKATSPERKHACRRGALQGEPKEAPRANDRAEYLVDNAAHMVRSLSQMHQRGLTRAKLRELPWSDSYWPLYQGGAAARYQHELFRSSEDWSELYQDTQRTSAAQLLQEGRASELSPAEKYDALMGDATGTLTRYMWRQGESYYRRDGRVETWMGLCHGWAAASIVLPTPQRALAVSDATGAHEFSLYVSDLKGLATTLFAQGNFPTRFIGSRCNHRAPEEDDLGPVSSECRDTNAGTWHLAVVNQIGVAQRSFVLDATYDYEVWNQPVVGYKYLYFVPQTKMVATTVEEGRLERKDFTADRWAQRRHPRTHWIIGVIMDATYAVENDATVDAYQPTYTRTVRYTYDLELDEQGQILGGEWYNNAHPDFLWVPETKALDALAGGELFAHWRPGQALDGRQAEQVKAEALRGRPVGAVIRQLFERSR